MHLLSHRHGISYFFPPPSICSGYNSAGSERQRADLDPLNFVKVFVLFRRLVSHIYNLRNVSQRTCAQEYNISNGDESEAERLARLLVEEAVARRMEVCAT